MRHFSSTLQGSPNLLSSLGAERNVSNIFWKGKYFSSNPIFSRPRCVETQRSSEFVVCSQYSILVAICLQPELSTFKLDRFYHCTPFISHFLNFFEMFTMYSKSPTRVLLRLEIQKTLLKDSIAKVKLLCQTSYVSDIC